MISEEQKIDDAVSDAQATLSEGQADALEQLAEAFKEAGGQRQEALQEALSVIVAADTGPGSNFGI